MRWFVSGVLALIATWIVYVASPYWALYRLATAMEAGNVAEIAERINVRALRLSIAKQLAADAAAAASGLAASDAQVAASAAVILAEPFLESLVTPATIAQLLLKGPAGTPRGSPFGDDAVSYEDLDDFLAASTWRGFRTVYVTLPPGEAPAFRYRLQLRFGRLRWRLVAVELPVDVRRRIAEQLPRLRKP